MKQKLGLVRPGLNIIYHYTVCRSQLVQHVLTREFFLSAWFFCFVHREKVAFQSFLTMDTILRLQIICNHYVAKDLIKAIKVSNLILSPRLVWYQPIFKICLFKNKKITLKKISIHIWNWNIKYKDICDDISLWLSVIEHSTVFKLC